MLPAIFLHFKKFASEKEKVPSIFDNFQSSIIKLRSHYFGKNYQISTNATLLTKTDIQLTPETHGKNFLKLNHAKISRVFQKKSRITGT